MAERTWLEESFSNPYGDPDPYSEGVSATDYPKAAAARGLGMVGDLGAAVRALGESRDDPDSKAGQAAEYLGHFTQSLFKDFENQTLESLSETSKRDLQSTFTDPNFWSLNAMAMKASNMTPDIAAAAIPSIIFPGVGTAVAIAASQGATLSAAGVVDDMYAMTDELSDADLQKQVPLYRQLRESGKDEQAARAEYNEVFRGMRPLITGAVGALTNVFGPAGQAARAVSGAGGAAMAGVGEGVAKRVAKGAVEGAASEAIQEGTEDYYVQEGAVAGGLQDDINLGQVAESAATGAVLGGVLGGGIGTIGARSRERERTIVDEALGAPPAGAVDTTAPNMPGGGVPVEMPGPVSGSGTTPTPGVPDMDVIAAEAGVPTIAQQMQARKNAGVDYTALPSEQQAVINQKLVSRGQPVNVVAPAAPDGDQTIALEAAQAPVEKAPAAPIIEQVRQEVIQPPTAVTPPPVVDSPPVAEARPEAPVAQPAPIPPVEVTPPPVVEPVPTGPRILQDTTRPDYAAENAAMVARNIRDMEQTEEVAPKGRNRTTAEQQARAKVRDGATLLAQKYPPAEQEAGLLSKRPAEIQAARRLILDRAKVISDEAQTMGLALPKAYRDNTNADQGYNPETLLVMEARRLATKTNPSMADYQRFMNRELDVRTGSIDQVVAERRAEGDAAMRQTTDVQADDLTDAEVPVDRMDPEAQLIAAEEVREDDTGTVADRRNASKQGETGIPPKLAEAFDKALAKEAYTVPKADRRVPVIETRKNRKVSRPSQEQVDRAAAPKNEKLNEILERNRAKKAEVSAQPVAEPVTPKVTEPVAQPPKLAAVKERVEKARQETNTNPTPAQAIAGNYKKGKVSIHGVGVAIENPKGSVRTNKDPNGPKWKVKLPVDYGYIEGTKGADGDPIDVYLGPNHDASYVYVIDQLNLNDRSFDEHKVMMGFKDQQSAMQAYDRAFSDGMGMLRVGDMRRMTLAEFKDWTNSDPKDRAGLSEEQANEARSLMIDEELERTLFREAAFTGLRDGYVMDPITKRIAKPVSTRKASEVMWDLDVSTLRGASRVIAGTARAQLTKLVGDVDVHILDPDDLARLAGRAVDDPPFGYHVFKGNAEAIFIRSDLLNNPEKLRHTVLHEVTHAATVKAIMADRVLNENIFRLGQHVYASVLEHAPDSVNDIRYGLSNTREFIAEAFSNPRFQEVLSQLPAPDSIVKFLNLDTPVTNLWDALIHAVRRALKLPQANYTMLEAAIRVTEMAMKPRALEVEAEGREMLVDGNTKPIRDAMKDALSSITKRTELAPTKGNPQLLGLRTLDNIARTADRYFQGNNVVRRIADIVEGQRVAAIKEFDKAAPTIQKLYDLQNKYRGQAGEGGQSVWENFTSLVHDETMAGVFADRPLSDQSHISKEGASDSWQRQQHPELARRFSKLPDDLKKARLEAMTYFRDKQNEVAQKLIRNRIVTLFDTPDPEGMATRIHEGTVTDADKAIMGDAYDAIAAAGVLSKINGPYFPLMRRGNFVVKGRYVVKAPQNATKIDDNEFEFRDKGEASKFASSQGGRPTMRTVYVDKTTGETTGTENGKTVRLTAQDMNAEARYRVVVQDRHMEMFDTMTEARARVAELRAAGIEADDAVPRSFENYGIQADALSTQMRRLSTVLERRSDDRQYTPQQKEELLATLNEVSLSMLGSTRIQSRSLPRQYVAGASKDFVRNTTDYAHSMGNYVAKLDFRPQLDKALLELDDAVKANPSDGLASGRTSIQNEIVRRITTKNPATEGGKWNAVSSRILAMSFIDKLMSPSYSVINAAQPMMITAPYLAGQYGAGKAYSAMVRAYNDIGSLRAIQEGFASTIDKMKPGNTIVATDPVSLIRSRLKNKGEIALIDILIERGVIDTDSGLEVSKMVRDTKGIVGKLDAGVGYLEGIARQMPKTVEAMNRTVAALAAYRLEMDRSGDNARAVQFAQDTVNMTQFNYSASNSAPFMNHPVLRLALQFKKFGVNMYQFMGEQAAIAIRNENPGDRARAIKSLSYVIGMHVLMAGAMGLPTEPIKLMVLTANGLGITDWSWQDVEDAQREYTADLLGKRFGEIVSRGVPRALGVDLSSRMGIDTLMGPFGEPRSNEAQDWKAYMWDSVAGAPVGLITDWAKGINDLAEGDVVRAAERLVPIKAFADSVKAYRTFTEGNVSEKTGKQTMSPFSAGEAFTRAMGFAPSREAESYERSGMFYRGRNQQNEVKSQFQREWVEANGAARGRLWREIQKWNRDQPNDARITLSDLRGYQKRMKSDMKNTKEGIRARKNEQHLVDRAEDIFNYAP
jgi:hypothetical protein